MYNYVYPNFKEWAIKPGNVHYNLNSKRNEVSKLHKQFWAILNNVSST
jgi:hypothetical protein